MKKGIILFVGALSFSFAKADEGMWLLSLLEKQNINKMQELGCKLSAEDIYSLNKPSIKDAIVGLGSGTPFRHFCTGELVSDKGLLVTNYHCGFSMIQQHSSVEHDYLSDGFWAKRMEDELTNEGATASILERMQDVTELVNEALKGNLNEVQRKNMIDSVSKKIINDATAGTDFSAQVAPIFSGNQFFLFVYTIYKDVRLVGAPPQSLGKFGGDTDNWMWPRHTCDFMMFRIYTGQDGRPATYSKDNIPLKPKYHLPISTKGIKDNDFAMILGFPGSTDRFATSYSLKNTMNVTNELRYSIRTVTLDIMKAEMSKSASTRIKYASKRASIANYWKYSFEQNKALKQLNTIANKEAIEAEFSRWVAAVPLRQAEYGDVLNTIQKASAEMAKPLATRLYLTEALAAPSTPTFAYSAQIALRTLCDKTTDETVKKDVAVRLKKIAADFYKNVDANIEENLYASLYKLFSDNIDKEKHPEIITFVNKKYKGDYVKFAQELRKNSFFMDEAKFNAFIEKPDEKKFEADLVLLAGNSFFNAFNEVKEDLQKISEKLEKASRLFVKGLMEMQSDKVWSPNANSTLRLTYGKVKSYSPRNGVTYGYQTTVDGVLEKEGPAGGEFEVPQRLKELVVAKNFGKYGSKDANNNDVLSVNFITDNDITGGNSGSPIINAKGELIGAAFDGNSEAMSGDVDFEENLQRCIGVDMRYVLFIIDKYAGAQNLLEEMTIVSAP
ncbi:hypothetical protein FACS1894199_08110 [Bacteroidia bacterium]|nr:hypothetical protein FACS1894199_08110 [Bacteroidia bacterium]